MRSNEGSGSDLPPSGMILVTENDNLKEWNGRRESAKDGPVNCVSYFVASPKGKLYENMSYTSYNVVPAYGRPRRRPWIQAAAKRAASSSRTTLEEPGSNLETSVRTTLGSGTAFCRSPGLASLRR